MRRYFLFILLIAALFAQQGSEFLIITHDDFAPAIQKLAQWKYMKGIQTRVKKLSEIGNNPTASMIRDSIVQWYNTWVPQPQYLLLVGDINFLPLGQTSPCNSDNYYANMTGDFKAELSVGRFPCRTLQQCSTMVKKVLAYEKTIQEWIR
ncbi:MAG: C25 family cysteine peptidase [candidate division WOR-3 bacterium]